VSVSGGWLHIRPWPGKGLIPSALESESALVLSLTACQQIGFGGMCTHVGILLGCRCPYAFYMHDMTANGNIKSKLVL
jgi:hypothetical protein